MQMRRRFAASVFDVRRAVAIVNKSSSTNLLMSPAGVLLGIRPRILTKTPTRNQRPPRPRDV
eukprot:8302072-Pyramimonas_sp.AAC.1